MSFTLSILGRPNVGKSTLFNRLAGKKLALVDDTPGVTRDRREGRGSLGDLDFTIMDTAGLEEGDVTSLFGRMRLQTEAAIAETDIVLMLIDARAGVTPLDDHFADWLRTQNKPVILVANKCEGRAGQEGVAEAYGLGLGQVVPFSAEHGEGLADLYEMIIEKLTELGMDPGPRGDELDEKWYEEKVREDEEGYAAEYELEEGDTDYEFQDDETIDEKPLQLAIIGRPNAGKSTLINHLVGEDRLIVGPEAGLTRDSIAVPWEWEGMKIKLFDTAGMRKKARVQEKLEKLSVADTIRAVKYAQVVVLMLDATLGLEKQDLRIAEMVANEGRGLVIALNKWDIVDDRLKAQRQIRDTLESSFPQLKGVPIINISALTGQGTQKIMPTVMEVYGFWTTRIGTSRLNGWLEHVLEQHQPPLVAGRRIKIRFLAQVKTRPPTFVLFTNLPKDMPVSYVRYMENDLRRTFNMPATPLRFIMKKGDNPFEGRRRPKKESKRGKRWKH